MDVDERDVAIAMCLESSLFFTRYFFKHRFNRKFVVGEHHELIANALDNVIKGNIKQLIINIAPRYGKTEQAVKNFIANGLATNPKARFIHLTYSDDLALDNSEESKNIVKEQSYQALFPNVKIKPNSDSKKKWYTTEGGGVYATSAGGQVTGFGAGQVDDEDLTFLNNDSALFGGALIIDDPIKPEDADSDLVRERINQRFDSTIRNRVNSRNTPIIIIMQRLHERDLCGYLQEQEPGEWTVLSLPSIKKDGTALWPFKHTIAELLKLKKQNELVFERQHMQEPKPLIGMLFPPDKIQYYKPSDLITKSFETSIGYVDVADEGSDNLAAIIGRNIKDKIYIPAIIFNKSNTDITLLLVSKCFTDNAVVFSRVESNNMGAMFGRALQKLTPKTTIQLITNTTNKHTRIIMESQFILKNFVFLHSDYQNDEYKEFMKELCKYMKEVKAQAHDDAPDSASGLSTFIRNYLAHLYQ